ncbi:site-specific DNA-methyltransferase [Neolewinella lacunae]|nr:site-specific DNA-methyltransferase [Neolewinella lacunae]MDN3636404.1 site-specific DNA-methyltransferase [Neolewinella lacunae]
MLIHGDNLLALKALEQEYAGKVKCVFIDPPYNTGSAFEHYDDGVEHSLWLSLMHQRINQIHSLLSEDGSLYVTLDDNEAHYFKVMCDEIFGRSNFIANVIWEKSDSPRMDAKYFSTRHDHLLVYAKNKGGLKIKTVDVEDVPSHYDRVDENGVPYYPKPLRAMGFEDGAEDRPSMYYPIIAPDGSEVYPMRQDGSKGRWRWSEEKAKKDAHRIDITPGRNGWSVNYRVMYKVLNGVPPETIWRHEDVGTNRTSKMEIKGIFGRKAFETPKPEALVERVINIATNPGDLVLDSFLGSGTTAAVAHKMGRRWIGIELGEHANTHCLPRLKKVVDGLDEGGITKAQNWRGGGGFKFYNLAPSLLRKDDLGQWVIDESYNADQLAAALAKHEGYTYAPDPDRYWKQAYSSEKDYLYVTTQLITPETIDHLAEQLGEGESLLVCCKAYRAAAEGRDPRINLHKIPAILAGRCEFGKDDYSLNIIDLPKDAAAEPFVPAAQREAQAAEAEQVRKFGKQKTIFD